ncbi:MAG: sulfite exporter TauE/SafE family protein [Euryarchaeota archaeon]|mgnify:FL=1|jgi:hypothetical protein|nr:sulfite exporter TauE/SafE family protein [Euryarchaeota archaeon]MBT5254939.1 sulfite exporter TauE/SafE family protein [Euryarchaeota archaeon]
MDPTIIFAIALLLFVALIFSPLGLGGGVLYVPIFLYLLDWSVQESITGSLSLVFMVALGSSLSHKKSGHADTTVANAGRITAIPFALVGTILAGILLDKVGSVGIKILAAAILIFVIERTIARMRKEQSGLEPIPEFEPLKKKYQIGTALAGTASGILGIGGGAILVTLNKSLLKMDAHKAAGTSYQIGSTIVPVALLSHIILDGIFYDLLDSVGLVLVILIPLLAFIFAFSGAKYAIQYLPDKVVTIVFLIAVSLSLIRYFIDFATMI